jgi:hypothetical protein
MVASPREAVIEITMHFQHETFNRLICTLMKHIKASFFSLDKDTPLNTVAESLDGETFHSIDISPWQQRGREPLVRFAIAYGEECIFLKYRVTESNPRAVYTRPNDPVYKDSCVEFFIALDDDSKYYNFEFNFFGNALVGYGSNSTDRIFLSGALIKKIRTQTVLSIVNELDEPMVRWDLSLIIPFELFHFHRVTALKGKVCFVNFYKCGDDLPDPHFLTWSDIQSASPDFHLPQFFGKIEFSPQKN